MFFSTLPAVGNDEGEAGRSSTSIPGPEPGVTSRFLGFLIMGHCMSEALCSADSVEVEDGEPCSSKGIRVIDVFETMGMAI